MFGLQLGYQATLSLSNITSMCLLQLFSKAGDIKRLIMGLDANRRTPCGFCFVSYFTRKDAEAAVKYINGSMMDGRAIRVDHDWGFVEGRQFGRGRNGGQVSSCLVPILTNIMLAENCVLSVDLVPAKIMC